MPPGSPEEQEDERSKLAGKLVARERIRQGLEAQALADKLGVSKNSLSKLENGKIAPKGVVLMTVSNWFKWGGFLDFVLTGNLDAADKAGAVDPDIREFAIFRLREIADPDPYRKPYGGLSEGTEAM